ncbi:MAG: sigma-70 family RNA polymerase sigma factor [Planctomycetales bacterium]|nr:sigma-70 family RNA polymerase sigma factor [Planctomycetales bacterium]
MVVPDTRISLIARLHDHDDVSAWMEFCAIYQRVIYNISKKYGLQDADAHEVSQNVLLSVSQQIHEFDTLKSGRFRGWLGRIARNATIDQLRKNHRELASSGIAIRETYISSNLDEDSQQFDIEAHREQFRWAAEKVRVNSNERTWYAFWSTAVLGQSPHAVAKQLGMSVGSVYVARCRTLAKIKALVDPFRGGVK